MTEEDNSDDVTIALTPAQLGIVAAVILLVVLLIRRRRGAAD